MKLKNKIIALAAIAGLALTNAAFAGNSAKIGYASDYFYRGAQKAEESLQTSLRLGTSLNGLSASAHVCSNQAVNSGNDSYHMGAGLGKSFLDELLGIRRSQSLFEDVPGEALSELELKLTGNTNLSPTLFVYRNLDESLYTYEVGVSHQINTDLAGLRSLNAVVGNTELSDSVDVDYYSVGVDASKDISDNASVVLSADFVDVDNIDDEMGCGSSRRS